MALPQKKFREVVFQMLYSLDVGQSSPEILVPFLMGELSITKKNAYDALHRAQNILSHSSPLDEKVRLHSKEYAFDRIPSVERNVLRLALFELLEDSDVPPKVAIAEGLRLTKKFSTPEAVSFVHALLDQIYQSALGENPPSIKMQQELKSSNHHGSSDASNTTPSSQGMDPTETA